jgi:diguanylate cyclase (GGDEF)-like protein
MSDNIHEDYSINPDIACFVIKTCLNYRDQNDFYAGMEAVTEDLRRYTESYTASIITLSKDSERFELVGTSVRDDQVDLYEVFESVPYEIIESWEWLVYDTDCIVIKSEEDMEALEPKAPQWVKALRDNKVQSLCLIPFIHQNTVIGYLFITDFDTDSTDKVKEAISLVSIFLASEVSHHLFVARLKNISNIDARTGVLNRNAMNNMVDELSVQLQNQPRPFSVAFCYLNTLKTINKHKGHDAGNDLLHDAGKILREVFEGDYIYRSSGDEFAVISTGSTEEEFEAKIEKLHEVASDPEWVYFTTGYYTDSSDGQLHSAMHFANEYEREFKEEFYYNYPDMVK